LHILVYLAATLLQLVELRLSLKVIQQQNSPVIGKTKPRRDCGRPRFVGLPLGFEFLIKRGSFGRSHAAGSVLLPLLGRGPVDQTFRNLFPLASLGAQVPNPVALNLVLGGELVGAVS